jgi:hypothetical protein
MMTADDRETALEIDVMVETESLSDMSDINSTMTRPIAQEDATACLSL